MLSSIRSFALLGLIVAVGCGPSNTNRSVEVTGKVTYKGAVVPGGNLTFHIGESGYPTAISSDGTFRAGQMPPGEAIVTVDNESLNKSQPSYGGKKGGGMSPVPEGANQGPTGSYVKLPAKYRDKTKSDAKVTLKAGKQDITIELKD